VLLADVDDHGRPGAVPVGAQIVDLLGIHLVDLVLDLADEVCAGSHYFTKNSAGALNERPGEDPDLICCCGSSGQQLLIEASSTVSS
jgi:hypothetical protein